MAVSAAVSVASFTVVLTETLTAVAAATLAPAAFLAVARVAHGLAANESAQATAADGLAGPMAGVNEAVNALKAAARSIESIDLLIPKTAKLHAEFEFQAGEATSLDANVGGFAQMVSINAGYSTLYTASSANKVTLDIDYAVVNYTL